MTALGLHGWVMDQWICVVALESEAWVATLSPGWSGGLWGQGICVAVQAS